MVNLLFKMHYHNSNHRYGYFVMKQPNGLMDYSDEGGPTDNCSPNMSVGRGPYRYKNYLVILLISIQGIETIIKFVI